LKKIAALLGSRGRSVQAYVSLAPTVALDDLLAGLRRGGIDAAPTGANHGVVAISAKPELQPPGELAVAAAVVRDAFGDLLRASDIVLGQAGTGNEQAVGRAAHQQRNFNPRVLQIARRDHHLLRALHQ